MSTTSTSLSSLLGGSSSSSSSSSSGIGVSSLGNGAPLQITGLASGLDTNTIIQEMMSIQEVPLTNLQNEQKGVQALNTNLQSIQSALQTLAANAQALSNTTLFSDTQQVTSTNPTAVSATATNGAGAAVGGYQISVTQLASAAQSTYAFSSPSAADTVTITPSTNGTPGTPTTYSLAAGASAQDLVNAINADGNGDVWATIVNNNIVFSNRTTGSQSSFTVSDSQGALTQPSSLPQPANVAGTDALYTLNGSSTVLDSQSNTVANAIPGVTLTLSGLTTTSGPATINVSAPTVSTSAIQSALQTFISSYNSVLSTISTQLSQTPTSSDPTQGTLYDDPELSDLLSNMREAMYQSLGGLSSSMNSMLNLGVSTGAATGSAAPSQNAIDGDLTLDTNALTQAIQSNPSGVTSLLQSFSLNFSALVNAVGAPGGSIDSRVQSDDMQISDLGTQITNMQAALNDKQQQLTQEFANLESVLSQNQSTSSWLTSQIASLPTA